MLKTLALIVSLASAQNAALMCGANCDTTAIRPPGCHQPTGECAFETGMDCVEAPVTVATIADASAKPQLPSPASSVAHTYLDVAIAASRRSTFIRGEVAPPQGIRPLPLRI